MVQGQHEEAIVGFIAGVTAPLASAWATPRALISGGADFAADAKLAIMEGVAST